MAFLTKLQHSFALRYFKYFFQFANEEYENLKSLKTLNIYTIIPNLRMYKEKLNFPGLVYLYGFDLIPMLYCFHHLEIYKYRLKQGMAIVVKVSAVSSISSQ